MHTVIAFSGMRVGEALMLPLHGVLEDIKYRNQIHYVIKGYTSKLDQGIKRAAQWVTSYEGQRAIKLAQRIASTILDVYGGDNPSQGGALLFCSSRNPYKAKRISHTYSENFIPMDIRPIVTQQDIDELNAMELARPWQRDGIEVGKPWPLSYHQYRRSLAVYAHRSGMVSLPGPQRPTTAHHSGDGFLLLGRLLPSCQSGLRQGSLQPRMEASRIGVELHGLHPGHSVQ